MVDGEDHSPEEEEDMEGEQAVTKRSRRASTVSHR
jgi:hypothetical protein